METKRFKPGEKKWVGLRYTSTEGTTVVIPNATYLLLKNDRIIQQGNCIIEGNRVKILLEPPLEENGYVLRILSTISDEKRIDELYISVRW